MEAHIESLPERLARWSRNNRAWVRAGVVALVLIAIVSSIAAVWINNERNAKTILSDRNRALADEKTQLAEKERTARIAAEEAQKKEAEQRRHAEQVEEYLVSAFRSPDPNMDGRKIKIADILDRERERLKAELNDEPIVKARLLWAIGRSYIGLGLPAEAVEVMKDSRTLFDKCLGRDHQNTLKLMGNLALAYKAAGELDKALALFEQTLEKRRVKLGDEHPDTLTSMNNLALAYKVAGNLHKAMSLCEQTLEKCRAKLGDDHPDTLTSMSILALVYEAAGDLDKALPLYEKTLEKSRAELGDDHHNTLSLMHNLAVAYREAGLLDKALPLHKKAVDGLKRLLGAGHVRTRISIGEYAITLAAEEELEKAIALGEEIGLDVEVVRWKHQLANPEGLPPEPDDSK